MVLSLDKNCKDADNGRRGEQHNEDPKVELEGRPVVGADVGDGAAVVGHGGPGKG